jgi:NAD(P)H-hydrate epimerase
MGIAYRLTRAQVREVDRRSTEQYHVPGIVLMENAAIHAANVAWEMLGGPRLDVLILCGGGNNGGDGYAVARHLSNRFCRVTIRTTVDPAKLTGDALTNFRVAQAMGISITPVRPEMLGGNPKPDLVIDAIFGTGLDKLPRPPFGQIAAPVNAWDVPVLAIDLPSGLDCDSGEPIGPDCIRAKQTVTFVAEKTGFANPTARQYTGKVTVADIGCPLAVVDGVRRAIST